MALLRHISILIVIYMISQPFCRAQIVEECPAGSVYSTSNGRCVSCSLGYYNDKPGGIVVSNDYSDCKFCPIGHKCPTPDQTPIKCPRGTVNSVDRLSCTPCSPGYYTDPDGAGWLKDGYIYSDCKLCLYGHYCPTPDVDPIICPPGTYSREGSTECTSCPEGYYNPRPGGTSKDSCLECPHGRYCPSKTQLPLECPPGTMSNSGRTSCISCPDGTYNLYPIGVYQASSGYAWYDECLSCPKQHYCPSSVKCPNPCPPKTENNYERKYKMDDCKPCNCTTTTNFSCKEQTYTNDYNNNFTISVIENNQQCLAKGDKNKMCDCDFYRRVNETFLFCSSIKDSMLNLGHELCKVLYSTPKISERWRDNVVNCLRKMAESLNIDSGCVNLAKNINRIHELCYLTADLYSTDKHSYTNLKCWEKSIINKAITKNFANIIQSNKILSTLTGQEYYSYVSEKDAKENCDILTYVHASLHAWYNETKYIKIIQFNPQFASYFDYILKSAQECNSFIVVTDSFRRHWHNITDDYYTPAKKSNHRVGYALDFNLSKNDCSKYCNSTCLEASIESAPFEHVDCFLGKIKTNSIGLEWGGLWQDKKPDTVHIYYNLTKTDSNAFDYYYSTLQKNCN